MFIAFEGSDVCGKGTQTEFLARSLGAKTFKFPDKNTPIGSLIYDHLFERFSAVSSVEAHTSGDRPELSQLLAQGLADPMMVQCMHFANRLEHARDIQATLYSGQDVVADRYIASGVVYGGSDGLDSGYLLKVQEFLPQPDINILLDIDIDVAVERLRTRGDKPDRYENRGTLQEVIAGYRQFWEKMSALEGSDRWAIVDGNLQPIQVQAEVMVAVKRHYATG